MIISRVVGRLWYCLHQSQCLYQSHLLHDWGLLKFGMVFLAIFRKIKHCSSQPDKFAQVRQGFLRKPIRWGRQLQGVVIPQASKNEEMLLNVKGRRTPPWTASSRNAVHFSRMKLGNRGSLLDMYLLDIKAIVRKGLGGNPLAQYHNEEPILLSDPQPAFVTFVFKFNEHAMMFSRFTIRCFYSSNEKQLV